MNYLPQAAMNRIWVLLIAAAVDLAIGDPHWLWHPVQGIGVLISWSEDILRRIFRIPPEPESPEKQIREKDPSDSSFHIRERIAGAAMVLVVLLLSTGLVLLLLMICDRVHPVLQTIAEGVLCGRLLALRSLGEAGFSVRDPLLRGDVGGARRAVAMIVGRDTDPLDAEGIAKAAVETVAENTSDGVTAPLFYMILLGGAGGIFYKAVNTMDSMTGYKNARYRFFGTAAARLDDVMNYLPSRLTALFMILACYLPGKTPVEIGMETAESSRIDRGPEGDRGLTPVSSGRMVRIPDGAAAFRIWRRDRLKSPSPNSAQTESVCAGALHLRLLGDTWYFGKLHHKEEIGDGGRRVEPEDITRAVRLMYRSTVLMFLAGILVIILAGLLNL